MDVAALHRIPAPDSLAAGTGIVAGVAVIQSRLHLPPRAVAVVHDVAAVQAQLNERTAASRLNRELNDTVVQPHDRGIQHKPLRRHQHRVLRRDSGTGNAVDVQGMRIAVPVLARDGKAEPVGSRNRFSPRDVGRDRRDERPTAARRTVHVDVHLDRYRWSCRILRPARCNSALIDSFEDAFDAAARRCRGLRGDHQRARYQEETQVTSGGPCTHRATEGKALATARVGVVVGSSETCGEDAARGALTKRGSELRIW